MFADSAGCTLGRFSHWWRSVWVSVFGERGVHTSVALASTVLLGCQKRRNCTLGQLTSPRSESVFFASFLCRFGQRNDVPPRTVANSDKENSSLTQTTNPESSNPAMTPTANPGTRQPGTNPDRRSLSPPLQPATRGLYHALAFTEPHTIPLALTPSGERQFIAILNKPAFAALFQRDRTLPVPRHLKQASA